MKKKIIILLIILLSLVLVGYFISYLTSFHTVNFKFSRLPMTATLYKKESNQQVTSFSTPIEQRLREGDYYIKPSGDNVDESAINFTVSDDATVNIDPSYSSDFLFTALPNERTGIEDALIKAYPELIGQFNIKQGQLVEKGQWYVTVLTYKNSSNNNPRDNYRVILEKTGNEWNVVGKPEILFTTKAYPNIPASIIEAAYRLNPSEA